MKKKQTRGFTIIKLMITIAFLAIVVVFGLPGFSGSINKNSVASTVNDLQPTLAQTHNNQPANHGITISMCSSSHQTSCPDVGWILFADANEDGTIGAIRY